MKNRFLPCAIILLAALLAACGKKESTPSAIDPAVPLPADAPPAPANLPLPPDLPPCPGVLSIGEVRGDPMTGAAVLHSSQPVPAILDFYTTHLAEDGWLLGASVQQGSEHHLQFTRSGHFLRLQIGPATGPGASRILLAWKQPAGTAELHDSFDPEEDPNEPDAASQGSLEW
jgi:hypothetical protein